ncbi:MAG TPA: outer membrane protein assembly factor BamA [Pyrinomonadaceae bacterium]|jgi:outer membrane protein insertion porin family|nr:outer membrane protein assembly factor BamA [Pyrinomonadaceae bacterium]
MHFRALWVLVLTCAVGGFGLLYLALPPTTARAQQAAAQQRLVESVEVEGNRRLRDEDILYWVQTRAGDPYNEAQVQRDFQAILGLGFFNKVESGVSTQDGPRGGVIIIFTVKELPIIRDIQFDGMKAVTEADVLKAFREQRVGVSKESVFDPVKANAARRVIKELLAAQGFPNATVDLRQDEVSATSTALTFVVKQGERVRVVDIQFEGNQVFSDGELRGQMKYVKEAGLVSRFKGQDILDTRKLEADLQGNVTFYMRSKGYLQARTGEPRIEGVGQRRTGFPILPLPLLTSVDDALRITVPIVEGKLYRIGEMKIEGNSIFSEQDIRRAIGLQQGDVADGKRIGKALSEDLKKVYGNAGFIQYDYEVNPSFKDNAQNPKEGVADFTITINEGKQFTLRRLEFLGNTFTRDNVLRREVALNEGDVYNEGLWEFSILRLNQLGFFDPIDKDKDADFSTDEERGEVNINLKVAERGRQQISFNGGISGIGGSFFGLEYSTNNLLGRGESLAFQFAFGNRQRSFLFSFTEPYIKDRPITAGFSVFTESRKFFGEGTILSENPEALGGVLGNTADFLNVSDENLFTQKSTGGSLFASAPLSEFYRKRPFTRATRIGLSYLISQTSVEDPAVNTSGEASQRIPVIFAQPDILTSRVTPTLVYDTRNASIDPTRGRQIAISLGFAGLGGDVRAYEPTLSFSQFIPIRRKRTASPEVFGFRLVMGHVGSFAISDKIRQSQSTSLAFINGVPIYERFFLGDEFTIRGYNVRSISPIVPIQTFLSTRNVVAAQNALGNPEPISGLTDAERQSLANFGTFTGPGGTNPLALGPRDFRFLGGDTQLLGNFEYRIPIFGPLQVAAFADIGSSFNLRKSQDQIFSSEFLSDQPFLSNFGGLSLQASRANPALALASGPLDPRTGLPILSLVMRDNRFVTKEELAQAEFVSARDPLTGLPFGFRQVFLRGEAQTNTRVGLSESIFSKLSNYRSSVGAEVRIQLPVVNVPFRLIYFYNPNARNGEQAELPGIFFREKKNGFRFSIGRTF